MPIYEYKCAKCDKTFDYIVKLDNRDELQICKSCGSESASRIQAIHAGGFQLTSNGWYATDFKSK